MQAQAILDMRLQKLTGLERDKILDEYQQVLREIERLEGILASDDLVLEIVITELEEIRTTYGDARRTEIVADVNDLSIEDLIAEEDMVVTVSRGGYIKRSALTTYRTQRRGGRGRRGMAMKEEDVVSSLFIASTHATMLVFTSRGRVFARKVHELPDVGPAARGRALVNLLPLEDDEQVAALLAVRDFDEHDGAYLLFATRLGRVKRTLLSDYATIRSNGLRAVVINDDDQLLTVRLTSGTRHVFMGTHLGMAIQFPESDVRPMGRVSAGVRGINLRAGDRVEEVVTLEPEDAGDVLVVTSQGFGKRTPVADFRLQKRGGYGTTLVKLTDKNGTVTGIRYVHEDDHILVVTERGIIIRMGVDEIRRIGRATQGVRLIRLDEGDHVVSVAKLVDGGDDDLLEDEEPIDDGLTADEPEHDEDDGVRPDDEQS